MKAKDICIITFDDWQAVYIDGKIVKQAHRVDLREIFSMLQNTFLGKYTQVHDEGEIIGKFKDGRYPTNWFEIECI